MLMTATALRSSGRSVRTRPAAMNRNGFGSSSASARSIVTTVGTPQVSRAVGPKRCRPGVTGKSASRSSRILRSLPSTSPGDRIELSDPDRSPERIRSTLTARLMPTMPPTAARLKPKPSGIGLGNWALMTTSSEKPGRPSGIRVASRPSADRRSFANSRSMPPAYFAAAASKERKPEPVTAPVDAQRHPVRRLEPEVQIRRAEVAAAGREGELRAHPDALHRHPDRPQPDLAGRGRPQHQRPGRVVGAGRNELDIDGVELGDVAERAADVEVGLEGGTAGEEDPAPPRPAQTELEVQLRVVRQHLAEEAVAVAGRHDQPGRAGAELHAEVLVVLGQLGEGGDLDRPVDLQAGALLAADPQRPTGTHDGEVGTQRQVGAVQIGGQAVLADGDHPGGAERGRRSRVSRRRSRAAPRCPSRHHHEAEVGVLRPGEAQDHLEPGLSLGDRALPVRTSTCSRCLAASAPSPSPGMSWP